MARAISEDLRSRVLKAANDGLRLVRLQLGSVSEYRVRSDGLGGQRSASYRPDHKDVGAAPVSMTMRTSSG
jgi:hypothetical protein